MEHLIWHSTTLLGLERVSLDFKPCDFSKTLD
jgi:hypothetical protein